MIIVLYVFDALRSDHLSCYGYERQTSPNLDALAKDGVMFKRCYSPSTWTRPSAASIFTGVYPSVHGIHTRAAQFSTALTRLPEYLQEMGFQTIATSAIGNVSTATGFNRGFDTFHDLFLDKRFSRKGRTSTARSEALFFEDDDIEVMLPLAEDLNESLFSALSKNEGQDQFLFAWSVETHVPFNPPPTYAKFVDNNYAGKVTGKREDIFKSLSPADLRHLLDLYDSEIYYNDYCFGEIVSYLKEKNLYEDAMIVAVGDHGEGFGEHGLFFHGTVPYEEMIHVPFLIKFPGNDFAGRQINALSSLIDVMPTILGKITRTRSKSLDLDNRQGKDLWPLLTGQADRVHDFVFTETQSLEIQNRYRSVRDENWKFIEVIPPAPSSKNLRGLIEFGNRTRLWGKLARNPLHYFQRFLKRERKLLFNLDIDQQEKNNVFHKHPQQTSRLNQAFIDWEAECKSVAALIDHQPLTLDEDELMRKHLEKLGYL